MRTPGTKRARKNGSRPHVDPEAYDQVMDILDVRFDSGSTHAFTLRDREDGTDDGIADVYTEGINQHRGWFTSPSNGWHHLPRALRNVVTHGMTLDEKGFKQSKSSATSPRRRT